MKSDMTIETKAEDGEIGDFVARVDQANPP